MLAVSAALLLGAVQAQPAALPPSSQSAPASRQAAPARPTDTVLISFRADPIHRLTVPIRINGRTHRFLVDTGAQRTGISLELARSLGLRASAPSLVTGFAGTSWVPNVAVPSLEFARSPSHALRALAFSREAIGADGFLGLDALRGQTVMFDFAAKRAEVRATPVFDRMIGPTARAQVRTENGRLVFTKASAGGIDVEALLDTGSSISVGNEALRRELAKRGKLGPAIRIRVLAVTGEIVWADYASVSRITIGGSEIRNMPVAFAQFAPFAELGFIDQPAMLLGMNALRTFDQVSIDFDRQQVRFTNLTPPSTTFRRTS